VLPGGATVAAPARDRDVGVLGVEQRLEPALLHRACELLRCQAVRARKDGDSDVHSALPVPVGDPAAVRCRRAGAAVCRRGAAPWWYAPRRRDASDPTPSAA